MMRKQKIICLFFTSVFVKEGDIDGPEIDFVDISKLTNSMFRLLTYLLMMFARSSSNGRMINPGTGWDSTYGPQKDGRDSYTASKMIFNRSILSNKLPLEWKSTNRSPIFKKGSKSELGHYRPVSLTAIPCTIMESIIRDKILKFA